MEQTTFIYSLLCPMTNQVRYIGKANNPSGRFMAHLSKCKQSTNHRNSWLMGLIKTSLKPILDIIDEVPVNEWIFWERHYISLYKSWGFKLVNMTDGGENPPINRWNKGKKMSIESRLKMSKSQIGNKNNLGKKGSPEKSKKLSIAHKGNKSSVGRILSDETKKKIGLSKVGNKNTLGLKFSYETKKKMSEARKGIILSDITRKRMSESKTGIKMTQETKNKISANCIGRLRTKGGKFYKNPHRLNDDDD